ncbi:MAG: glycosyltransferase family 39 protein [Mariprofundaceae bacterium]|nr:glycosyltransferase family 39 protein [Mariprofundaceae bacterium]
MAGRLLSRLAGQPVWLLVLCGVSFFVFLGGHMLWDVDEPNNAVCAREMLTAGNWWVPVFNGDLRFDKPILIYWLMMPLYAVFGISEFTARLPSAMAMTGLMYVIWYFTCRLMDRSAATIAAVLFASALHMVVIARAAVPDPLLMLCLGFALLAFLTVYMEARQGKPSSTRLLMAAYAALGLGMLAKGPIAAAMPVLILSAFLTLQRDWASWRVFRPWMGIAIAAAIALPWYIAVGVLTDGEWLRGFLFHHNLDRFTDSLQGHRGFPGLYVVSFILGWFPWSGLLVCVLAFGAWRLTRLREQPMRLFLLCWLGVFLIFFSIARTQLPNYMLPAFPAAAVLIVLWLHRADESLHQKAWRWLAWTALAMGLILAAGGAVAIQRMWPGEWFYALALAPVAAGAAWWLKQRNGPPLTPVLAGMVATVMLLVGWSVPGIDHHKVTRQLAKRADAAGFDGKSLATFHYFQPSLLYYHGGRLPQLGDVQAVGRWLVRGRAVVMPEQALAELPREILPYLLIHARVHGLYARKMLLLLSLQPVEGMAWPKG